MKPWWKWRPIFFERVPRCIVRIDGGEEHADFATWRRCGRKVEWGIGLSCNDPAAPKGHRSDEEYKLWQVMIPLCKLHKTPTTKVPEQIGQRLQRNAVALLIQVDAWQFIIALHPLSWLWWGTYSTDPHSLYLGPLRIVSKKA